MNLFVKRELSTRHALPQNARKANTVSRRALMLGFGVSLLALTATAAEPESVAANTPGQAVATQQHTPQVRGTLRGTVVDENGEPLAGATVAIKGTKIGTAASADGEFTLGINGQTPVLVVSYVGMTTKEIRLTAQNIARSMRVTLSPSADLMDDVVVTGYQTLNKERATGSFDIIDKKQLEKASANISSRLIGAVAGLTSDVDAYGNPTFEIRGTSSFSVNSKPLLVVDGFPIEGGFDTINPNDVENITILKDAAAASIWGAKSANGVIVITTKSGRPAAGKATTVDINYSGFYKVMPKLDLEYYQSRCTGDELIDYETSTFGKWGSDLWWSEESDYSAMSDRVLQLLNENRLGHITDAQMQAGINQYRGLDNTDQIRKYILNHPMTMQQNLGISVNTDRSSTNISLLYQNEHTHWKGDSDCKYMFSLNNRTSLYKWVDVLFNGTVNYLHEKLDGMHGLPGLAPYEKLVGDDGQLIRYDTVSPYYLEHNYDVSKFPYQDWTYNPLEDMAAEKTRRTTLSARAQVGLSFKIWQGLTFDSKLQYEVIDRHYDDYTAEQSSDVRLFINKTCSVDPTTGKVTQNVPSGGFLDRSRSRYDVLTIRNQVNFNHTFADEHTVAFVAGLETTDRHTRGFDYARVYGYNDQTLAHATWPNGNKFKNWMDDDVNLYDETGGTQYFSDATDRYFSVFGNASYTFRDKYTVSGSYRTDASNLITDDPKYRYAPFWSVGASWQIGKEKFMKDISWVNRLNVRFTYGFNGNVDKTTTFKPLVSISSKPNSLTNQYTGSIASYGNPTLRWEKTGTWDFGVDYNLFGGKLYGKLDIYRKLSEDLIATKTLSIVNGVSSMKLNSGKILNKGFELEVGSRMPITDHISWNGVLRLSYNKNRVESLKTRPTASYQLTQGGSTAWVEGEDMNTLWCLEYAGLINSGSETSPHWAPSVYYEGGEKVGFNSYLYGDVFDYVRKMGTKVAPWGASLQSSFSIYDFDFSFILTGKFGHKFMRESYNYPTPCIGYVPNAKYSEIVNCDPNVMCPQPQQDVESRYYFWDRFYPYLSYLAESASHIRVQELSLSYNVPKQYLRKVGMKSAQVSLIANNPFNIYFNSFDEDPEFGRGGMRLQSSYTIGLKLGF